MKGLVIALVKGNSTWSKTIRFSQKYDVTHVALVKYDTEYNSCDVWESDFPRGVKKMPYESWKMLNPDHELRWWPGNITDIEDMKVSDFLRIIEGQPYGFMELIGIILRPLLRGNPFDNSKAWICTEMIESTLTLLNKRVMLTKKPKNVRPRDMAEMLRNHAALIDGDFFRTESWTQE